MSADYDEVHILAADPIEGVNISTTSLVDDKYVPRNESTRFKAILVTGENVTLTTAGSESVILSDWTISINGAIEKTYNGMLAVVFLPLITYIYIYICFSQILHQSITRSSKSVFTLSVLISVMVSTQKGMKSKFIVLIEWEQSILKSLMATRELQLMEKRS